MPSGLQARIGLPIPLKNWPLWSNQVFKHASASQSPWKTDLCDRIRSSSTQRPPNPLEKLTSVIPSGLLRIKGSATSRLASNLSTSSVLSKPKEDKQLISIQRPRLKRLKQAILTFVSFAAKDWMLILINEYWNTSVQMCQGPAIQFSLSFIALCAIVTVKSLRKERS